MSCLSVIQQLLARRINLPASAIDVEMTFREHGLGAVDVVELVMELEERIDVQISDVQAADCGMSPWPDLITPRQLAQWMS